MNLSENLKRIRKENNLSQEQLAEKLGVSRQSVSKWESGQAYPEMDKMLQLCEMFHLNIDDLLNQDIKDVNSKKKSKINVNKYIDSFLDFITKTTKMFGAMSFKEKVKCVFEQIFIIAILVILGAIIGLVLHSIIDSLLSFLPGKIYYYVDRIWDAIIKLGLIVIGVVVILHIFKIRYLNYYEIVHEDEEVKNDDVEAKENIEEKKENSEEKKDNVKIIEPKEKIIIRDPKHSEYGFIKGLVRVFILILKVFALFAGFMFIGSLIGFSAALVLSFTIAKTGSLFIGILIALIAAIAINIVFLVAIYKFITGREHNGKVGAIIFLISLLLVGVGIGLMVHGASNIEYKDVQTDETQEYFIEETYEYDFEDDLAICCSRNIEYHEEDIDNIVIKLTHYKDYDYEFVKEGTLLELRNNYNGTEFNDIKTLLKDINKRKAVNYSSTKIDIHASKENIEKLKINYHNIW
ncbi:MAG: helix-turn-helix transcriptional regulator [Bacilli bacterium]|nr:helix-turn-helix transcriptional regulator [Bacilli bacterium]